MAWIELHQAIWTHRKTFELAALLDLDETYAAAHVIRLWTWALDNAPEGKLADLSNRAIAFGAGWRADATQFVEALTEAGWLDPDRSIHDWQEYAGRLIERRGANAERMRAARANRVDVTKNGRAAHVQNTTSARAGATVPYRTLTGPDHTPPVVPPADAGGDIAAAAAPRTADEPPRPTKTTRRKTPATPVPDAFPLTDRHLAYAREYGLDSKQAAAETEKFLAHHRFKGTLGSDWYSGWQNWIRNAVGRFAEVPRSPPNGRPRPDDYLPSTAHRAISERF